MRAKIIYSTIIFVFLFLVFWSSSLGCTSVSTTTTTWITYIQYEVLSKQIFYDGGFFGFGSQYRMDVKVNGNKIERWKLTDNKEFYYKYNVGDFFYEKRIHQHGIDSKELLPGKVPQ